MISFISWNIRGIANGLSLRRFKKLIHNHKISWFDILEPRVSKDAIQDYQRKLNSQRVVSIWPGTIWLLWKYEVSCSVNYNNDQHITIEISIAGFSLVITCIFRKG